MSTSTAAPYTLSLHDALPISTEPAAGFCDMTMPSGTLLLYTKFTLPKPRPAPPTALTAPANGRPTTFGTVRSEEHTSELQSLRHLVCRLLLEKNKQQHDNTDT